MLRIDDFSFWVGNIPFYDDYTVPTSPTTLTKPYIISGKEPSIKIDKDYFSLKEEFFFYTEYYLRNFYPNSIALQYNIANQMDDSGSGWVLSAVVSPDGSVVIRFDVYLNYNIVFFVYRPATINWIGETNYDPPLAITISKHDRVIRLYVNGNYSDYSETSQGNYSGSLDIEADVIFGGGLYCPTEASLPIWHYGIFVSTSLTGTTFLNPTALYWDDFEPFTELSSTPQLGVCISLGAFIRTGNDGDIIARFPI